MQTAELEFNEEEDVFDIGQLNPITPSRQGASSSSSQAKFGK